MSEKEIWDYFWERRVFHSRPLDRDFIWVTQKDFEPMAKYFVTEFNLFHQGKSMRSQGLIAHIHAVHQGDHMFIHQDTGNLARFFPLGVLHLFFDLLPYLIWERRQKGISRKLLYLPPQKLDSQ